METGIKKGFTLIELLAAITIFGILFVGLLNSIFFGLHANIINSQRIRARQIMSTFMDNLRNLNPDHPFLENTIPGNGLDNITNPDHIDTLSDNSGMVYEVLWNIEPDPVDAEILDIRVFVFWRDRRFFISSQTSYYKEGL
ncbi:MAG: type II secretion system protein [candidate division WOR-3 bacterium]